MTLRYIFLLVGLTFANPSVADPLLQRVLEAYQDECVASVEGDLRLEADLDPNKTIEITIRPDSIYQLEIGAEEFATIVFANFGCASLGTYWCGSGGCNTQIIVRGNVYDHFGYRPFIIRDEAGTPLLVLPAQGTACTNTGDTDSYTAAPCYRTAVWDDRLGEFWISGNYLEKSSLTLD